MRMLFGIMGFFMRHHHHHHYCELVESQFFFRWLALMNREGEKWVHVILFIIPGYILIIISIFIVEKTLSYEFKGTASFLA